LHVSSRFLVFLAVCFLGGVLLPDGSLARPGDPVESFGTDGLAVTTPDPAGREAPAGLERLPDGSLLAAGSAASGDGSLLIKYRPDGSIDSSFGDQGKVRGSGPGWQQLDLLPDGGIMLGGGKGTELVFERLDPDGSPDPGFGGSGRVSLDASAIAGLPDDIPGVSLSSLGVLVDGGIRAIGGTARCDHHPNSCGSALVVGLDANGDPVPGFGTSGVKALDLWADSIVSVTFADGRSTVVTSENYGADGGRTVAVPVTASGDRGEESLISSSYTYDAALGRYSETNLGNSSDRLLLTDGDKLWRLEADGAVDPGFGQGGEVGLRDLTRFIPGQAVFHPTGIATDGQDRILISGGLSIGQGATASGDAWASSGAVARLGADGSIDSSFGGGGIAIAWPGVRAGQRLQGRTGIVADGNAATLAGMGPAGESYGFTLARIKNDAMRMPVCRGQVADYLGTPGRDLVHADMATVVTGGGNDVITGGLKATICSGKGDDTLRLERGPARVYGDAGEDRIRLGPGANEVHGGRGADRIVGGAGPDRLSGDAGDDLIFGGLRDDRIMGGSGNDRLFGQGGRDWLFGGRGQDLLRVGPVNPDPTDYVLQGAGTTVRITTLGRKAGFFYRVPTVCQGEPGSRFSAGRSTAIPFDPSTGKVARVTGTMGEVFADYGGFVADVDARVRDGRITGRYRIIDNFGDLCRTGTGPVRIGSLLKDAWVSFSIKAAKKPRQLARQG